MYHTMNKPEGYNAGNFQEYTYECEWIECAWKQVHGTFNLVSAYWYPWFEYGLKKCIK